MSIQKLYIILIFIILESSHLLSQEYHYCGYDIFQSETLESHKNLENRFKEEESKYQRLGGKLQNEQRSNLKTIPVVFHIIHDNGTENVTDAQIKQTLELVNDAFANRSSYNSIDGVDTDIQFCLAQRDTLDKAFGGIVRYQSAFTDMSLQGSFPYLGSLLWNPKKYINIQIVKKACLGRDCNIAGFAGYNRIVVNANYMNGDKENTTVLIHELGHYLGLDHTFKGGCKNDDCLKDGDKVCDTPPDNQTFEHCFTSHNSCSTDEDDTSANNPFRSVALGGVGDQDDDHTNFMDYNWMACDQHFTQGQSDRMHFMLEERYSDLLQSKACLPPCEEMVNALFNLPDSIEVGQALSIINLSTNGDVYQWYINGLPISTSEDLSHAFLQEGLISIILEAYTNDTLCESQTYSRNIRVYCPIKACFNYVIQEQYLVFDDCSQHADKIEWTAFDEKGNSIYNSALPMDSLYVNNIDFVRICLNASGEHCDNFHCEYITITSDGSEICNNEKDDDGDGLIDMFDPDCPCNETAYQAQCPPDCEIVPDSFPDIKMKMKWESEVISELRLATSSFSVGDIYQTNGISIISPFHKGGIGSSKNYIATFRADNGLLQDTFRILPDYSFFELATYTAVAKDKFSEQYFIYGLARDTLLCINQSGVEIFKKGYEFKGRTIGIADFNGDGLHEVYIDKIILNGITGAVLIDQSSYCDNFCFNNISVAADVLGEDGRPELISGKYIFDISILNTLDSVGNSVVVTEAPIGVSDGKCSVADIDQDGKLEIIVVQSNEGVSGLIGNLSVWNPRNQMLLAQIPNPILGTNNFDGSIPFVGDVDGDCIPEIGVVYNLKFTLYKFISNNLEEMYSVGTSDRSGITGITMFDFNQDGRQELIYRDETHLRIFDGATGETIDSTQMYSGTFLEYPIVADVDNDGQAEIIISGSRTSQDEVRMYCFESATTPWAPARSVWNQYAYNPTQVNDDLTIPRYQQNAAQPLQGAENCPRETCNTPYNNFMVQATYRTQEGCYVWPELQRDLTISAKSRCIGDSIEICFYATSTDTTTIRKGVTVSYYPPPWDNGVDQLLDSITIRNDTTCIMMPKMPGIDSIMIVINDADGYYPPTFPNTIITECDYTNNEFVLQLGGPDFSIDIVDWECSPDSLIFYIATDNVGLDSDVSCIGGGCYFTNPVVVDQVVGVVPPIEYTNWCFDYDTTTLTYQYQDTFRVAIPHPIGKTQMWWTINEGGFGPGVLSSEVTGINECNYTNNIDSIAFDLSPKTLDLGPDISKCETEVITLNAGAGFASYEWSDFTTDSIYSTSFLGIHSVTVTDACGRSYSDTIVFTIDPAFTAVIGPDASICEAEDLTYSVDQNYQEVHWFPTANVDCDTCHNVSIIADSSFTLYMVANLNGCIITDTAYIEILQIAQRDLDATICESDSILFYGNYYNKTGDYKEKIGVCDSVIVLHLSVMSIDSTLTKEEICQGDSLLFMGTWFDHEINATYTLTNATGCDSVLTLELRVRPSYDLRDTISICAGDSILLANAVIKEMGDYPQYFTTALMCDSILTTHVDVLPSVAISQNYEICEGDSALIFGSWVNTAGEYSEHYASQNGCDSTAVITLSIQKSYDIKDTLSICEGDSVWIGSSYVNTAGDYTQHLSTITSCDSTITTTVNISPYIRNTENMELCEGDTLILHDRIITEAGSYVDTLSNTAECTKIETTIVSILPTVISNDSLTLCPEESTVIHNVTIDQSGTYDLSYANATGCDSIVHLQVRALQWPPEAIIDMDCKNRTYSAVITPQWPWTPLWSNGSNSDVTTLSEGGTLGIILTTPQGCEKSYTYELPIIPDITAIPSFDDAIIDLGTSIALKIDLDANEWSARWYPSELATCDTCLNTSILATKDTTITITLTHISGCSFETNFRIQVKDQINILIPNVFSPNSGNENNLWTIHLPDSYLIQDLSIYDRWGNKVHYSSGSNTASWDGKLNGQDLLSGVYVYQLKYTDIGGNVVVKVGDITKL